MPRPCVQTQVVVVAACGNEPHARDMAHHVEPDQVVIKAEGVLDVRHVQMDVAHLRAARHRRVDAVIWREVAEQLLEVDRVSS